MLAPPTLHRGSRVKCRTLKRKMLWSRVDSICHDEERAARLAFRATRTSQRVVVAAGGDIVATYDADRLSEGGVGVLIEAASNLQRHHLREVLLRSRQHLDGLEVAPHAEPPARRVLGAAGLAHVPDHQPRGLRRRHRSERRDPLARAPLQGRPVHRPDHFQRLRTPCSAPFFGRSPLVGLSRA